MAAEANRRWFSIGNVKFHAGKRSGSPRGMTNASFASPPLAFASAAIPVNSRLLMSAVPHSRMIASSLACHAAGGFCKFCIMQIWHQWRLFGGLKPGAQQPIDSHPRSDDHQDETSK
ncbi:hypothetical protein V1290_004918 [Bradyrhizobium sp. AZCC 1578]|uniref:hypothetical protein n=1 Tax=Bradyrhizobium sp. AZCC 1578 TaxID=3117027 RepID=UPI002FF00A7D